MGKIIMQGEKERQGDFAFSAQTPGEYSFCFSNEMSTFAEKLVDFEISVRPSSLPRSTCDTDEHATHAG